MQSDGRKHCSVCRTILSGLCEITGRFGTSLASVASCKSGSTRLDQILQRRFGRIHARLLYFLPSINQGVRTENNGWSSTYQFVLSVRPSIRPVSPPVRPSVHPSVRPFVSPSVRPSVRPFRPSVHPSLRPSVRLSVRPSVRPSVRFSVRPSVSPSFGMQTAIESSIDFAIVTKQQQHRTVAGM